MIGTLTPEAFEALKQLFQSPISGVNDWNCGWANPEATLVLGVSVSY